jgi:hypothetical protein
MCYLFLQVSPTLYDDGGETRLFIRTVVCPQFSSPSLFSKHTLHYYTLKYMQNLFIYKFIVFMENQKLMSRQKYKCGIFFKYYFGSFEMMQ